MLAVAEKIPMPEKDAGISMLRKRKKKGRSMKKRRDVGFKRDCPCFYRAKVAGRGSG